MVRQDWGDTMKIFWLDDSLCLKIENDAERNALQIVNTALSQATETEVETEQAPAVCPGLNPREITRVNVAHEAQLIANSLTRMQSLLSRLDAVANTFGSR
jgi:hypothetical protein